MICPDCGGSGRIRRRFLIFFTRRARCRKCLGTGTYPPAFRPQVRVMRSPRTRDLDDDRWAAPTFGPPSGSPESDRDRFDVGSGGRSGGGGATTSWDAPHEAPPVIADPFREESGAGEPRDLSTASAVTSAASADAADTSASADSSSGSQSSDGGGTAY